MKPEYIFLCVLSAIVIFIVLEFLIEFVLMGCGINVQEKLMPHMYDTEIGRDGIARHFKVDAKKLGDKVVRGRENMANKRVVITALARDIEGCFPKCIDKIMLFTQGFKDYRIVIFENDSKDMTREYLKKWVERDGRVELIDCCGEGDCGCRLGLVDEKVEYGSLSKKRIVKMARLRNRVLDYVKKHYSDYDYMMVVDMDMRGGVYKEGFQSSFAEDGWDAIFAKGIKPFPFMFGGINYVYDMIAYVDKKNPKEFELRILGDIFFQLQRAYSGQVGSDLVPVGSAFNGVGIYKLKKIIDTNARYDSIAPCEHIDFHKHLDKLYGNPSFIVNMGLDNETQMPFKFLIETIKSAA